MGWLADAAAIFAGAHAAGAHVLLVPLGLVRRAGRVRRRHGRRSAERALAEAETRLRRVQAAIEAGADPAALIDPLNRAQERVMAGRLERDLTPSPRSLGRAEIEAMLDYLGDVGAASPRPAPTIAHHPTAELCMWITGRVRC